MMTREALWPQNALAIPRPSLAGLSRHFKEDREEDARKGRHRLRSPPITRQRPRWMNTLTLREKVAQLMVIRSAAMP